MQIKSTWYNFGTLSEEFSTYSFDLPKGNYTYSSMLAFLNTNLPAFADFPYNDTVYGLGGIIPQVYPPVNQPVSKDEFNTKLIFSQYANILTQTIPDVAVNEHVYQTFEIVNTPEVYRLFVMLGLVLIQNPLAQYVQGGNFVITCTPASRTVVGANAVYTYNVSAPIYAPYSFDFSSTKSLYVFIESFLSAFRSPFEGNNPSNLIARVPLNVLFGEQFSYLPSIIMFGESRNATLSNLQLTCRDDFNELVDFQNTPAFIDLHVKFGVKDESVQGASGTNGVPSNLSSNPTLHASGTSYGGFQRDSLFASQKNPNSKKRSKLDE
jgi:hypothetical protein